MFWPLCRFEEPEGAFPTRRRQLRARARAPRSKKEASALGTWHPGSFYFGLWMSGSSRAKACFMFFGGCGYTAVPARAPLGRLFFPPLREPNRGFFFFSHGGLFFVSGLSANSFFGLHTQELATALVPCCYLWLPLSRCYFSCPG